MGTSLKVSTATLYVLITMFKQYFIPAFLQEECGTFGQGSELFRSWVSFFVYNYSVSGICPLFSIPKRSLQFGRRGCSHLHVRLEAAPTEIAVLGQ